MLLVTRPILAAATGPLHPAGLRSARPPALGDADAALDAEKNLRPEQFPTAERKARVIIS
ncbi:hypothetical protein AB0D62_36115 [Streptomyces massasporeus]|uniref:hypothetical protein n=1 Tax=Streptomyces massasporeus TaxID=67324 RepID=UPI0033F71544